MFVLPTVVIGAAVLAVLPASIERGVAAIVVAHVLFNLAVVVRTVGAVLSTLPRDREAAAATLGASPRRVFREIMLPAILPAIGAAAAIVFVFTFTSFGVVRILGGVRNSTIEVEIWRQATRFGDIGSAATLTVMQLVAIVALVGVSAALQRRRSRPLGLTVGHQRQPPRRGRQRRLVAADGSALRDRRSPCRWRRSSSARCGPATATRWAPGATSGPPRSGRASPSASTRSTPS